jgi:hypothetical protein
MQESTGTAAIAVTGALARPEHGLCENIYLHAPALS